MLNASSSKEQPAHDLDQSEGREGISSGMKSPPSDARPFRTTSSKESWGCQLGTVCGR